MGLVGQCAVTKQRNLLTKVPPHYTRISSSLGKAPPSSIVVLPLLFEGQVKAVIELASLHPFTPTNVTFLEQLTQSIGVVLNTIEATMRTENLLKQSQQLTGELQSRQSELQQTNEELASKARLLAEQNAEVERKNSEVEQARRALEEKAAELALTSKYKSEFLANMSHELRTPLNSILILSQQLADNSGGNLTPKQVEFARNVNSSGSDLLNLINDILDLSKIESGTVTVEAEEIAFSGLRDTIDRTFRHVAETKNLPFVVHFATDLPPFLVSDPKRLQQILKNLVSNAIKFTTQGHVEVRVGLASQRIQSRTPGAFAGGERDRLCRGGHRRRRGAGEAAANFRGLPTGRRRHVAQVRRYRAGPGHKPRAGCSAGRRDPLDKRTRRGQHLYPLPAAGVYGAHDGHAARRGRGAM